MNTVHAAGFVRLVESIMANVQEIEVMALAGFYQAGGLLLDVREESEWAAGHIGFAQHLGKGIIERDIEAKVPDLNTPIALICGGGYRSALAADNLQKMGYQQVYSVAGGMKKWRALGLPEQR